MAAYLLETVKTLVARDVFTLKGSRCRDELVRFYGCTTVGAREKFREMTAALAVHDFSETVVQHFGQEFDVYAKRWDGIGWYIKFAVDIDPSGEENVLVLSCHRLSRAIRTRRGKVDR